MFSANWTLEMAVPWTLLGNKAVAPGRTIGWDFGVDDDDNLITNQINHFMLWAANGDTMGGPTQPCCSTHAFGAAQLVGR
jgi:hypothetical protein